MASKINAPGLRWRQRANGECKAYWVGRSDLVKKGYKPKTVPLHYDLADPASAALLIQRCHLLQDEMLQWAHGAGVLARQFTGTVKSLCDKYQSDADSPFRELQPDTRKSYAKHLRILCESVGDRRLDAVSGADVRRWYKRIAEPTEPEGKPRLSYAYTIIGIFKAVVSYGGSLGAELVSPNPCIELRAQLAAAKFTQGPARDTHLTHEQVTAFCNRAHEVGRHSMARGVLIQFECAFRQRDVIGRWDGDRWERGLTWSHVGKDGWLRKRTSKNGAPAEHRIADYPDLAAELERTPAENRVGPLVIDETNGLPYKPEKYRRWFRAIAREVGIPDEVWNMDSRAGAVTEAYESGATTEGAMALATHTQVATSRRYRRKGGEASSQVAKLRVSNRTNGERR
jgi:hypothetical protein